MPRSALPGLVLISTMAVAIPPVHAETVSIIASKDNTLYQSDDGAVSNGSGGFFFSGVTDLGNIRRAVLEFDVASNVPAGVRITVVKLRLNVSRETSDEEVFSLHRARAEWGEGASDATGREGLGDDAEPGDATWLHTFYPDMFWNRPGGDFGNTVAAALPVDAVGAYTWGSTPQMASQVQRWLDNPSRNHGWVLIGNEDEFHTAKRFDAREAAAESNRPTLMVTYEVPEPQTAFFLLLFAGARILSRTHARGNPFPRP